MFDDSPEDDYDGYDGLPMDPECSGPTVWSRQYESFMKCGCWEGGQCPHTEADRY